MIRWLPLCLALLLGGCSDPTPAEPEPSPTPEAPASPTPAPTPRRTPGEVTVTKLPPLGGSATNKDESRAGKPKRWLGITVANMDSPIEGAPDDRRCLVTRALRGGPADTAGLKRGDVILRANSTEVRRFQDYLSQARKTEIGDTIDLVVLRDRKEVAATLTMVEKPADNNVWRRKHFPGTAGFEYDMPLLRGGERFRSADAKGKPQLLYFWATWCGPCRKTGPWVEALYEQAGDRLHLVAISSEELDKLTPFLARTGGDYPVGHDSDGTVKQDYEVNKLPTAVLLDAAGDVLVWDIGTAGVQRAIREARALLKLPEPASPTPPPTGSAG